MENRPEPPIWTDLDSRVWDAQGRLCGENGACLQTVCPCCGQSQQESVWCSSCGFLRRCLGTLRDALDVRASINLRILSPSTVRTHGSWEARIGQTWAFGFSPHAAVAEMSVRLVRLGANEQVLDPWMSDERRSYLERIMEAGKEIFEECGGGDFGTALKVYRGGV